MTSLMTSAIPTESASPEQSNHVRFVALGIYIVLMIVDLWLIISLTHFGIKTRKWRRLQSGNPDLLSSGKIYMAVIFCFVSALVYHIVVAVYRNVGYQQNEDELCNTIWDLNLITYTMCSFSVILFLWLRQRMLYTAFLQTVNLSKALKIFSFMIIFVTIVGSISGVILSILPNDYIASPIGCIQSRNGSSRVPALVILVFTIVFSQIALLAVFIHGLLASYRSAGTPTSKYLFCCQLKSPGQESHVTENPRDRTQAIVQNVVRKTIIFAALSLLSDVLIAFGSLFLLHQGDRRDTFSLLTGLSVSMNLSFVIFSFIPWKNMIASPCRSYIRSETNTTSTNLSRSRDNDC